MEGQQTPQNSFMHGTTPKELIWGAAGLILAGLLVGAYVYYPKEKSGTDTEKGGAVGTTEEVSKRVPEITTNAAENVPEVNPLDRANPFKYNNPLR